MFYIRKRTLSDWKQLRRNRNTCSAGKNEVTSLAGGRFHVRADCQEREGQFQIMDVGNGSAPLEKTEA